MEVRLSKKQVKALCESTAKQSPFALTHISVKVYTTDEGKEKGVEFAASDATICLIMSQGDCTGNFSQRLVDPKTFKKHYTENFPCIYTENLKYEDAGAYPPYNSLVDFSRGVCYFRFSSIGVSSAGPLSINTNKLQPLEDIIYEGHSKKPPKTPFGAKTVPTIYADFYTESYNTVDNNPFYTQFKQGDLNIKFLIMPVSIPDEVVDWNTQYKQYNKHICTCKSSKCETL